MSRSFLPSGNNHARDLEKELRLCEVMACKLSFALRNGGLIAEQGAKLSNLIGDFNTDLICLGRKIGIGDPRKL
jgi:hypothetical protein